MASQSKPMPVEPTPIAVLEQSSSTTVITPTTTIEIITEIIVTEYPVDSDCEEYVDDASTSASPASSDKPVQLPSPTNMPAPVVPQPAPSDMQPVMEIDGKSTTESGTDTEDATSMTESVPDWDGEPTESIDTCAPSVTTVTVTESAYTIFADVACSTLIVPTFVTVYEPWPVWNTFIDPPFGPGPVIWTSIGDVPAVPAPTASSAVPAVPVVTDATLVFTVNEPTPCTSSWVKP
ncbi:hypothetical protein LPJ56_006148 [Coemansia sp. RSA 2599]|nr:hypothetical protein LPJ75_006165 [Coemansia sp. RSA 2598]KAJ1808105.1 hypothetical protein LPJ56_006148 [Coemansia sp. RSA 2599]